MRRWLGLFLLCILPAAAMAEVPVPPLEKRVTDLTGTLTAQQQAGLEAKLATFEQQKGSQLAVLIMPSTQPEAIEQYSIRVVEEWKLGRKGVDDGVLLLVAKNDRKMRIEVGYGLEGALNDATCKRIVAEIIAPRFKQGDFAGGVDAGVDRIIRVVNGEPLLAPTRNNVQGFEIRHPQLLDWLMSNLVFVLVGFVLLGLFLGIFLGAFQGALINGTLAAMTFGWIIWSPLAAVVAGLLMFFFTLVLTAKGSHSRSGSSYSGGDSSGGGFSSSDSGSGFSGGGGDFGGGGASGDW